MGRRPGIRTASNGLNNVQTSSALKVPAMKFTEAAKLADKNSRTIAKLQQLVVGTIATE
jgi:hypothetical protein